MTMKIFDSVVGYTERRDGDKIAVTKQLWMSFIETIPSFAVFVKDEGCGIKIRIVNKHLGKF